jgi:hypothetical protein
MDELPSITSMTEQDRQISKVIAEELAAHFIPGRLSRRLPTRKPFQRLPGLLPRSLRRVRVIEDECFV